MIFAKHSSLEGQHAFLGASKCSWLNYSDDKLIEVYYNERAKERGTKLHEFAAEAIKLGIKLPDNDITINRYVNDAIGFRMTPEQVLYYSTNCFGTADAISFRKNFLRIHDLKTGKTKVHREQLEIYAALFCLEYDYKPSDIEMELRIYQSNKIDIWQPDIDDILPKMDKIVSADKLLSKIINEEI